jgi:uncharacterized protein (TIGR03437 family)
MRKIDRFFEVPAEVWDLETWNKVWTRPNDPDFPGTNVRVSDDGTLFDLRVVQGPNPYTSLFRNGSDVREVARVSERVISWDLDAGGHTVMALLSPFDAAPEVPLRVVRIDVTTGEVRDIAILHAGARADTSPALLSGFLINVSADGQVAVAPETVDGVLQLFAMERSGSGFNKRQLTNVVGGIISFALSGDGRAAWVITNQAQVLKVDVLSEAATEFVGPSFLPQFVPEAVPGSQYALTGYGLARGRLATSAFPWPESLDGVRITVNGTPLRLETVSPNRIAGQIPWSTRPGPLVLDPGFTSSFEIAVEREPEPTLRDFFPTFLREYREGAFQAVARHQDWRGPVTPTDPAKGGEVVHLYASGLGPVLNTPPDGEPTPAGDRYRLVRMLRCESISWRFTPIEVLYSGLAPGTIGIYQVSLRLPEQLPGSGGKANIRCYSDSPLDVTLDVDPRNLIEVPEILVRADKPHVPEGFRRVKNGRGGANR